MGARAQVKIQEYNDTPFYLYTHWGSASLVDDIKRALGKEWRWDDYEYLARIIFDEMIGNEKGGETGFGISTSEHGDIDYLIQIFPNNYIKIDEEEPQTFKDFINS